MKIVVENNFQKRLDQYLATTLEESRNKIQQLIKEQKVVVNGKVASASYRVQEGDEIEVDATLSQEITVEKENIPIDVVYEDDD